MFTTLLQKEKFFNTPEEALRFSVDNARARRAQQDLLSIKGSCVIDGRCEQSAVTFVLSNGLDLIYYLGDQTVDWRLERQTSGAHRHCIETEPIILKSEFGEGVFDPLATLRQCLGRKVLDMSAGGASAQLLLTALPLIFTPCREIGTGRLFIHWFALGEPDEKDAPTDHMQ